MERGLLQVGKGEEVTSGELLNAGVRDERWSCVYMLLRVVLNRLLTVSGVTLR